MDSGGSTDASMDGPWDASGDGGAADADAGCRPWDTTQIAAGVGTTCAVDRSGSTWCWGTNGSGELGDGSPIGAVRATPALVSASGTTTDLSLSAYHACAVMDGQLFCWGLNDTGQLGLGDTLDRSVPTRVGTDTDWAAVSVGEGSTCGLRSAQLFCWGDNGTHIVGATAPPTTSSPQRIGSDSDWTDVSVSTATTEAHACGIRGGGLLFCWGNNASGELGLGDTAQRDAPTQVGTSSGWRDVGTGVRFTCALRDDGAVYCWGSHPATVPPGPWTSTPVREGTETYGTISVGSYTVHGITTAGELYCWGNGRAGNCATGAYDFVVDPTRAGARIDWTFIADGREHACGVAGAQTLCAGWNWGAMAGTTGDFEDQLEPTPVCAP